MTEEEKYMSRCIQLAGNGTNQVSPNPKVGAVIVCDGIIIGEGYHVRSGCGHAEVRAIGAVKDAALLRRSTLYVTLEPCSHYGKTPPCADLIVRSGIPRVVIGCQDPSDKVAGKGIRKLRDAGVDVTVGILEESCKHLIRRFTVSNLLERPYVTLKWAQSADGFIDLLRGGGTPVLLSNPLTQMLVHKQRAETDAILVGTRTALLDNPSLTVRNWHGDHPLRLVLDKDLTLPSGLTLFDGKTKTWVFTAREKASRHNLEYIQIDYGGDVIAQIMRILSAGTIQSLLVEGGSRLLQSFIDRRTWDECFVETSPLILSGGVSAPRLKECSGITTEMFRGARVDHIYR